MTSTAIIFLPGLLCDADLWQAPLRRLATHTPCMVADLTQHMRLEELASEILSRAPANFQLVGLSMGGYVAFEICRQAPSRVQKLVLLNTSARPDSPEQRERRLALIELSKQGKFKGVTPRLLPLLVNEQHLADPQITGTIMAMAERTGQAAFERQQTVILGRPDSRPDLAKLTMPSLIIGGADDQLTPPIVTREIASGIAGARYEELADCGHLSPLEQPKQVTALLEDFLQPAAS